MGMQGTRVPDWRTEGAGAADTKDPESVQRMVVVWEVMAMIDEGLLEMGVDKETGEAVFWPTPLGCKVLGMEM